MDDTLAEVDLDEWNNAFVGAMTKQLTTLYTEKDVKGIAIVGSPCAHTQSGRSYALQDTLYKLIGCYLPSFSFRARWDPQRLKLQISSIIGIWFS